MLPTKIRILIVDDDALIRKWFSMLLTQIDGADIELFEADNGEDALAICRSREITLVVTDIKMPVMDGITLIKALKEEQPEVRTAVLSAYDDFEYVQVALRCGALDYVLKVQMQLEDIQRLMQKLRENLNFEKGIKNDERAYQNKMRLAQAKYLEFLQEPAQSDAAFLRALNPQFSLDGLCLTMMRLDASASSETPFGLASVIYSVMLSESIPCVVFPVDDQFYLMFSRAQDGGPLRPGEFYLKLLTSIDQNLRKFASARIAQNIKVDCAARDSLRKQLSFLRDLIDYQVYYGVTTISRESARRPAPSQMLTEDLRHCVESGNAAQCARRLKEFVRTCHDSGVVPRRIRSALAVGIHLMLEALPREAEREGEIQSLNDCAHRIAGAQTKEKLEKELAAFCEEYLTLESFNRRALTPAVAAAIEFIEEHYAAKITLGEVAAYVSLNGSYLSHLFTKEVKSSFVDYIELVRIRNAQKLIRTSHLTMLEIAEAIGYPDQNYFSKVFKKRTGMNPTRYKKECWK
ncbi:MAG: response regulator [Christensenellaceae bacterium]|nr:response regulator [Christensenellaceae bacterium]